MRGARKLVVKYRVAAGITKQASCHSLRHTFVTYKAEQGVSAFTSTVARPSQPTLSLQHLALVPGNLLPYKAQWQALADDLPLDTMLLVFSTHNTPQVRLLAQVARLLEDGGCQVVAVAERTIVSDHPATIHLQFPTLGD